MGGADPDALIAGGLDRQAKADFDGSIADFTRANDPLPGGPGRMSEKSSAKDILVGLIVAAVLLGFLALAAVYTADVYYKSAWIVTHFPPKGPVCTELFCLRTDTIKPQREFLKLHFAYCADHLPSGFQGRGARSNGVVLYLTIFVTALAFLSVPIVGALFRIMAWPALVPMVLAGKLPPRRLLPFTD